jgi:hypothetical protein
MNELIIISLLVYGSYSLAFILYSKSILETTSLVSSAVKGQKLRKIIDGLEEKANLYLKLSPIWPAIICLMIIKKIKG